VNLPCRLISPFGWWKIKRAVDKKILPSKRGVWFLTQNSAVTKQFFSF